MVVASQRADAHHDHALGSVFFWLWFGHACANFLRTRDELSIAYADEGDRDNEPAEGTGSTEFLQPAPPSLCGKRRTRPERQERQEHDDASAMHKAPCHSQRGSDAALKILSVTPDGCIRGSLLRTIVFRGGGRSGQKISQSPL